MSSTIKGVLVLEEFQARKKKSVGIYVWAFWGASFEFQQKGFPRWAVLKPMLGRFGDRQGSSFNLDIKNPYVWVQIDVRSFGPLSHTLLEYRLYIEVMGHFEGQNGEINAT